LRVVIQRVSRASVSVDGRTVGHIGRGLLVLLGVGAEDEASDAELLAGKVAGLRCFADEASKFNLSVEDIGGSVLVVSQFTLFGDCRKGKRPSFTEAAPPERAIPLYDHFVRNLRQRAIPVETGEFGAHMEVGLVNDGPVTLLMDSKKVF